MPRRRLGLVLRFLAQLPVEFLAHVPQFLNVRCECQPLLDMIQGLPGNSLYRDGGLLVFGQDINLPETCSSQLLVRHDGQFLGVEVGAKQTRLASLSEQMEGDYKFAPGDLEPGRGAVEMALPPKEMGAGIAGMVQQVFAYEGAGGIPLVGLSEGVATQQHVILRHIVASGHEKDNRNADQDGGRP